MHRLRSFLIVFTAVLIAVPQVTARAQEEKVETFPVYAELDGFEHGVARLYEADWEHIPGDYQGVISIRAVILRFDTDAHASAALETFGNLGIGAFAHVTSDDGEISFRTLPNLGDGGYRYRITVPDLGHAEYVFAREGVHVFAVLSLASTSRATRVAATMADYLIGDGEVSPEEEVHVPGGGSTGGLWGFLPPDDHEMLEHLLPVKDSLYIIDVEETAATPPADAQDEDTDVSQFDGAEHGVRRTWSFDVAVPMAEATILPNATPDPGDGIVGILGAVVQFDSDGHASAAYQQAYNLPDEELISGFPADAELAREDIDNLGDEAFAVNITATLEDGKGYLRVVYVHEDEYLFTALAVSLTDEGLARADALIDSMVNEGQESDAEAEFDQAGGSSGGLWGFFPENDHESVRGFDAIEDKIIFPEPEEDPAATPVATAETVNPLQTLATLEGIHAAVARTYMLDYLAFRDHAEATGSDPSAFADPTTVIGLTGYAMQFDSVAAATAAYETLRHDFEIWAAGQSGRDDATSDIDGLGDAAMASAFDFEVLGATTTYRYVVAHSGEYLFIVAGAAQSHEAATAADDLVRIMIERGPSPGEVVFDKEGVSSGGLWNCFPEDDDRLPDFLDVAFDQIIFPVPS